jgi:tyrosyl-tRNA synthetase
VNIFPELQARGLVHDSTPAAALEERLASHSVGVYVGFDPTANSLHVGHLLGQISLRRLQLAGHRPFPLAGGATGMVGDPSGRSEERNLLDAETLSYNVSCISEQLSRLLDFSPGKYAATLVNNADWTAQVTALDFLRDVGKHITINQMLAKDSVKSRLTSENGLSFTEFSYMLLQANDFRHLNATHDVELQMGGSDQWGNITAGIDLIRKTLSRQAHGITWPLVTRSDGSKFSLSTLEECAGILAEHAAAPEKRVAQKHLAHELTAMVHGTPGAQAAAQVSDILFGADPTSASVEAFMAVAREVPCSTIHETPVDVVTLLSDIKLCSSKSEARRTIEQGGVRINGQVVTLETAFNDINELHGQYLLVRRGKTSYHLVEKSH